ncbi:MAG TPA: LON peptidase substrate-binding domain-containing protein [bacterium]
MKPPPDILPIFPLTGVLLLPGMWLPLHIFEPRYRNMITDAREGAAYIGMIQPVVPRDDNRPKPDAPSENPEVYGVGCAGDLDQCEQLEDGRYYIQLKGVSRFRVVEELPLLNGYRRVHADYSPFPQDGASGVITETAGLIDALVRFGQANNLPFDRARLVSLPGDALVNGLSMSLPFGASEKQALLEAAGLPERQALLLTLLGMGVKAKEDEGPTVPPTLN